MANTSNAGEGAPPCMGGIVNLLMGEHAYEVSGQDEHGHTVTGHGRDSESANADYQSKGGKT